MHREMMQQPMLQISIQFAMNEMVRRCSDSALSDFNTAAQNFFRLQGAHEFIKILRNLAEMPVEPPKTKRNDQLTQT